MVAELKKDGTVELTIEREFSCTPKAIFEAWLQPEQLSQWWGPTDDFTVTKISVNAVVGGEYYLRYNDSAGTVKDLKGIYKIIDRYTKLVFTWVMGVPSGGIPEETLVTLDFMPTVKGTKLTLCHQKFSTPALRDRHNWGWNGTLDKLARYVSKAV